MFGLDLSDDAVLIAAIGTALALVAAVAAIVGVWQNRRSWRASHLPELHLQVTDPRPDGSVNVILLNGGGGPAKGTSFLLVVGDGVMRGTIGLMEGGRRSVLQTRESVSGLEPFAGVISCWQPDGSVQAFFGTGERKVYSKRPWRRKVLSDDEELFASVYPDFTLDGRRELSYTFPMLTQP